MAASSSDQANQGQIMDEKFTPCLPGAAQQEQDPAWFRELMAAHLSAHENRMSRLLETHHESLSALLVQQTEKVIQMPRSSTAGVVRPSAGTRGSALSPVSDRRGSGQGRYGSQYSQASAGIAGRVGAAVMTRQKTTRQADHTAYQETTMKNIKKELESSAKRTNLLKKARTKFSVGKHRREAGCIHALVYSPLFETICGISIVLNAVTIGVELDWRIADPTATSVFWDAVNIFFVVLFGLELLLRMVADGTHFCSYWNRALGWNIFDTILVMTSIFEEILRIVPGNFDMTAMRIFRMLRLIRSFRIVRVFRLFRDLRVMLTGIIYSVRSLLWALLLLFVIIYLVAICLLQSAAEELSMESYDPLRSELSADHHKALKEAYGSLMLAVYTLYCSITGGVDWKDAAEPMLALSAGLGLLFCVYIAFAVLCVLNIITGVFVESANRLCLQDDEMVLLEQMEKRNKWLNEVKELFSHADEEQTGTITLDQFEDAMTDVRIQAHFRKLGVEVEEHTAEGLFTLLDIDGDGRLDLDEFVLALESVHGSARAIDLARIRRDMKRLRTCMDALLLQPRRISLEDEYALVPEDSGPEMRHVEEGGGGGGREEGGGGREEGAGEGEGGGGGERPRPTE